MNDKTFHVDDRERTDGRRIRSIKSQVAFIPSLRMTAEAFLIEENDVSRPDVEIDPHRSVEPTANDLNNRRAPGFHGGGFLGRN
ncbi:MAG TPA: hypothetical protein PKM58_12115 [Pyrinomonadaceae bacterium]|nr:hypothetical protein [Pyrinomonadaceae bacterium]